MSDDDELWNMELWIMVLYSVVADVLVYRVVRYICTAGG